MRRCLLLLLSPFLLTVVANLNMFGNYIWNCYCSNFSQLSQSTFKNCWFNSKRCKVWLGQNTDMKFLHEVMPDNTNPNDIDWYLRKTPAKRIRSHSLSAVSPGEVGELEMYSPESLLSEWNIYTVFFKRCLMCSQSQHTQRRLGLRKLV